MVELNCLHVVQPLQAYPGLGKSLRGSESRQPPLQWGNVSGHPPGIPHFEVRAERILPELCPKRSRARF